MNTSSFFKYFILVISAITSGVLFSFLITEGGGLISNAILTRTNQDESTALQAQIAQEETEKNSDPLQTDTALLYFVGDIMLDHGVEQSVKKNFGGDFNALFENLESLKEADILFGNLEGPVSDEGSDTGKKYSFRMDPEVIPALKEAGFDVVSFANNHVLDWGQEAFTDTLLRLRENEIQAAGAGFYRPESEAPRVLVKNGIKIGFLAFSDIGPQWSEAKRDKAGIMLANDPYFESLIRGSAKMVDFLVVSLHFGEELEKKHNKRQEELARKAIDNGARLVVGHHPHVIQDIEYYKDGLIAYSLGNFIFEAYSEETTRGLLLETTIARNPFSQKVEIVDTKENIIKLSQFFQPQGIGEQLLLAGAVPPGQELALETEMEGPSPLAGTVPPLQESPTEEEPETVPASSEIKVEETKATESSSPDTSNEVSREEIVKTYLSKNIYSRGPRQNKVALTIDDGWNIEIAKDALEILERHNIQATLFPVGVIVERNPSIWKKAIADGNELGNHSYTHPFLYEIDKKRIEIEIKKWQEVTDKALGYRYKTVWFRPPWMRGFEGGEVNETYYETIEKNGLKVALWSLGTYWGIYKDKGLGVSPEEVSNYIIKNTRGGEIILLHFIKPDIDALSLIIEGLKQKGFEFVTLSELLGD